MTRGTTPTNIFTLPFYADTLKKIRITYKQGGNTILEKTEDDVVKDGRKLLDTLTQEETLKFDTKNPVFVQVRVLKNDGSVHASHPKKITVYAVFNDEVL